MSINTIRQRNIRALIQEAGGPSSLAARLGHSGPSYLSQLANTHRPVTEKTARKFEQSLGLRTGWLDEDTHESERTLPACPAILGQVVQAVSEEMETQHVSVDPPRPAWPPLSPWSTNMPSRWATSILITCAKS